VFFGEFRDAKHRVSSAAIRTRYIGDVQIDVERGDDLKRV